MIKKKKNNFIWNEMVCFLMSLFPVSDKTIEVNYNKNFNNSNFSNTKTSSVVNVSLPKPISFHAIIF